MELLVAYDVSTETREGRRRLRRVAQACEAYGQRVQKSVFECSVNAVQREQLIYRLLHEIEPAEDSLRIYRLVEPRENYLLVFGIEPEFDLHDPLVL
jgi:CRISPR-associated protein Cas2